MMRLRLPTGGSRGTIGLDIDGGYMAAVEVRDGRIDRAVSADLPAGLVADGEVNDAPALAGAIRDFFKRHDLPRRVRLGVANQQIAVRSMDLPAIEVQADMDAAVRFQAAEAIAMPLDETVLDYQVVGESTGPEGLPRARVVVVAARESMVTRLIEAVRGGGLRPLGIDLSAFALVRALASGADEDTSDRPGTALPEDAPTEPLREVGHTPPSGPGAAPEPGAAPPDVSGAGSAPTVAASTTPPPAQVYCHLAGVTNLAVAVGHTCLFTRSLSAARDPAGAPLPVALAEEIRLSIDYYMAQPDAPAVGELLLSGPASSGTELPDELGELLAMPVSTAPPLANLDVTAVPRGEDPRRYTVAAGLALGATA